MTSFLRPGDTILFQGDSITDVGRRDTPDGLGTGYPAILHGWFRALRPDAGYQTINRGIGGDRTAELVARWKPDCLDLKPDVLSISIGVNDVWRIRGEWNGQTYLDGTQFEANYRRLLDQARGAGIDRIVLMSPTTIEEERDAELSQLLDERTAQVRSLAQEYKALYVPTREAFVAALKASPKTQWTLDGCHPTVAGHALLAATWWDTVTRT